MPCTPCPVSEGVPLHQVTIAGDKASKYEQVVGRTEGTLATSQKNSDKHAREIESLLQEESQFGERERARVAELQRAQAAKAKVEDVLATLTPPAEIEQELNQKSGQLQRCTSEYAAVEEKQRAVEAEVQVVPLASCRLLSSAHNHQYLPQHYTALHKPPKILHNPPQHPTTPQNTPQHSTKLHIPPQLSTLHIPL